MSATSTSRIWESPSEPSALNHSSRSAQLPSIATLTNALPAANGAASSPTYPLSNRDRDSDHWPSQPQSTRKFLLILLPVFACEPHLQDRAFSRSFAAPPSFLYLRFHQARPPTLLVQMAITIPRRSILPIAPRIPASLELRHIPQITPTLQAQLVPNPRQASLHRRQVWGCRH